MAAHPHAELMALYAKDAAETDKPWERWQIWSLSRHIWNNCTCEVQWSPRCIYRRKPERPWYRVALFKNSFHQFITITQDSFCENQDSYETAPNFVKWVTDRVYYDVE